jgi:hypothetical protein
MDEFFPFHEHCVCVCVHTFLFLKVFALLLTVSIIRLRVQTDKAQTSVQCLATFQARINYFLAYVQACTYGKGKSTRGKRISGVSFHVIYCFQKYKTLYNICIETLHFRDTSHDQME